MCIVSMVTDTTNYEPDWWHKINHNVITYKTATPFSQWNYEQCLAYVELLEKAAAFDNINNEPECYDPEKVKILKSLDERIREIGLENKSLSKKCLNLSVRLSKFIDNNKIRESLP